MFVNSFIDWCLTFGVHSTAFQIRNHYCPVRLNENTDKHFDFNQQRPKTVAPDLKIPSSCVRVYAPAILLTEWIHEPGTDRFQPDPAVCVVRRFPHMCAP